MTQKLFQSFNGTPSKSFDTTERPFADFILSRGREILGGKFR